MAPSQMGAFARSDDKQSRANLEYHVQPLSLEKFGDALHDFPAFTASVCNLQPSSRGHVHITSANPREAPAILCNYLHTEQDRSEEHTSELKSLMRISSAVFCLKNKTQNYTQKPNTI